MDDIFLSLKKIFKSRKILKMLIFVFKCVIKMINTNYLAGTFWGLLTGIVFETLTATFVNGLSSFIGSNGGPGTLDAVLTSFNMLIVTNSTSQTILKTIF